MRVYLNGTFPTPPREELKRVADDVRAVVAARMGSDPPEGLDVVCYVRRYGPMTKIEWEEKLRTWVYRVGLTVTTRDYARFAYQLGHELGHVLMGTQRTNGPMEIVAVALSLQVLDDMAARWEREPPTAEWRPFAPSFRAYRAEVERQAVSRLPGKVQAAVAAGRWDLVRAHLAAEKSRLLADVEARDLQHLAAMTLMAGGRGTDFRAFKNLAGLTDPPPARDKRFRADLPLDPRRIPYALRGLGIT